MQGRSTIAATRVLCRGEPPRVWWSPQTVASSGWLGCCSDGRLTLHRGAGVDRGGMTISAVRRVVRASAIYDIVATAAFALPWTAAPPSKDCYARIKRSACRVRFPQRTRYSRPCSRIAHGGGPLGVRPEPRGGFTRAQHRSVELSGLPLADGSPIGTVTGHVNDAPWRTSPIEVGEIHTLVRLLRRTRSAFTGPGRPARCHQTREPAVSRQRRNLNVERAAVSAAAERLLAGTPLRVNTAGLTATELITESGLPRDVIYRDHKDLVEIVRGPVGGSHSSRTPSAKLSPNATGSKPSSQTPARSWSRSARPRRCCAGPSPNSHSSCNSPKSN